MDLVQLCRIAMSGRPGQISIDPGDDAAPTGLLGVDVAERAIDGEQFAVVQVLFDDDRPGFDQTLLDGPIVAEVIDGTGAVTTREPFDHDRFRQRLLREQRAGDSILRGVLVLTEGELPPPWIRLAFLAIDLGAAAGSELVVRRTSVLELVDAVDESYAEGRIGDDERRAMLISIEQRYPDSL